MNYYRLTKFQSLVWNSVNCSEESLSCREKFSINTTIICNDSEAWLQYQVVFHLSHILYGQGISTGIPAGWSESVKQWILSLRSLSTIWSRHFWLFWLCLAVTCLAVPLPVAYSCCDPGVHDHDGHLSHCSPWAHGWKNHLPGCISRYTSSSWTQLP